MFHGSLGLFGRGKRLGLLHHPLPSVGRPTLTSPLLTSRIRAEVRRKDRDQIRLSNRKLSILIGLDTTYIRQRSHCVHERATIIPYLLKNSRRAVGLTGQITLGLLGDLSPLLCDSKLGIWRGAPCLFIFESITNVEVLARSAENGNYRGGCNKTNLGVLTVNSQFEFRRAEERH
ncbi:MAG: hypothetical protein GY820_26975 [Gammaproteobacteria bacterium]|nr:hypothetical protein [Gammaproteobacteria bacterium]